MHLNVKDIPGAPGMRLKSSAGAGSVIKVATIDPALLRDPENPTLEELLAVPKKQEVSTRNLMLRRGLAYYLYRWFYNHGAPTALAAITQSWSGNTNSPFLYLICSDSAVRPLWTESDGLNNANAGANVRACAVSDTAGVFKRVYLYHVSSAPYKTLQIVFYVSPNSGTSAPKGLDNFVIKSIGFAKGANAQSGGGDDQWALRAVLGRPPRYQGVTEDVSIGEGSPTLYPGSGNAGDHYMESGHSGTQTGDKVVDGDTSQYGLTGTVDLGDYWESAVGAGPHMVARLWATTQNIHGCRIASPSGANIAYVPKYFKIQYLDPATPDPSVEGNWKDISGQDYSSNDQSADILAAGEFGKAYSWTYTPCRGIRLKNIYAQGGDKVQIAELMLFKDTTFGGISTGTNTLSVAIDAAGVNFASFTCPNVAAGTLDVDAIVTALNTVLLGYELEAEKGPFGHLWIQATPAGTNSKLKVNANTVSTINDNIGITANYGATPAQQSGADVNVTKATLDALTITVMTSLDLEV